MCNGRLGGTFREDGFDTCRWVSTNISKAIWWSLSFVIDLYLRVPANANKGLGERARFCISTMLSSWGLDYIMKVSESTKFVGAWPMGNSIDKEDSLIFFNMTIGVSYIQN